MSLERMTVSLEDFLKYLVKRWLVIISCVVVGIIVASLFAKTVGYAIVIPASENYEELKTQEAYFEDYIENSVTMKMNPLNIYENSIFVDAIADRNALKDFLDSGKVWEEFGDTLAKRYLAELIFWEEPVFLDKAELKVQHSDAEQCAQLTDYVAKQIQIYDESLNVSTGTQRTVIDESVSDVQMWYTNRLKDIKGQLEYTAEGCTLEISMIAAIITGAMAGGIGSVFVLLVIFLLKPELRSDDEIAYYTKAPLVNEAQIITLIKNKKKAVLINLAEQEFAVTGVEVVCNVETAEASILSSEMIFIAASANKTMYKELAKVLEFLKEKEKEIQGCIAC